MKHVLFALVLAACTSDPASARTPHGCAPPAATPAPIVAPATLEISKHGVVLGYLVISRGKVGTLTIGDRHTPDALELQARWHRIETGEQRVQVEVHEITPHGGRGALATRFYQPNADDYVTGVRLWLTWEQGSDDGYDVK